MQDINPWALATVALLAIMLAHLLRRRRPTRSSRDGAYRRGLEYALAELHLRGGRPVLVRRPLSDWPSWADDMRADRLEQRS